MPELAEVEFFRRVWEPAEGLKVVHATANLEKRIYRNIHSKSFPKCLIGTHFQKSFRKGKQLCFLFNDTHWLGLHMGMTGRLHYSCDLNEDFKYNYLTLFLENEHRLIFQDPRLFGKVLYEHASKVPDWWEAMPLELTDSSYDFDQMNHFLEKRPKSRIKSVLLMQDGFPGIGNWMADEILWRSRIAPFVKVHDIALEKRNDLYRSIKEVCNDALKVIADGWKRPPDSWLFNHRWADGGTCPKTKKPLIREKINGRTACWSPSWQTYH